MVAVRPIPTPMPMPVNCRLKYSHSHRDHSNPLCLCHSCHCGCHRRQVVGSTSPRNAPTVDAHSPATTHWSDTFRTSTNSPIPCMSVSSVIAGIAPKLTDNAQKSATSWLKWHAKASAQNVGHQTWSGGASTSSSSCPVTLTLTHQPVWLHQRAGAATTRHTIGFTMECNF